MWSPFSLNDIYFQSYQISFQFNNYFGELDSEKGLLDDTFATPRNDEEVENVSDSENYEEIVTELVVASEEAENVIAEETFPGNPDEIHQEPNGRGHDTLLEEGHLEGKLLGEDIVQDVISTEGSVRKRCHPCVHCTEVFMHRLGLICHKLFV